MSGRPDGRSDVDVSVLRLLQFQQTVTSELKSLGRSSYTLCVASPLIIRQALHPEASKKVTGQTELSTPSASLGVSTLQVLESSVLVFSLQISVIYTLVRKSSRIFCWLMVFIEIAEQILVYFVCLPD